MKNIFLYLGISLLVFSCKKENENNSKIEQSDSTTLYKDTITKAKQDSVTGAENRLDKFGFPSEVEGCSCYFSESKNDFQNEKFVYVDDYGNNAYIKIDGKLIKIPMEEGDFDPSNFNKSIENADYRINMTGKKINELDETMMFEGKMTVENKKTGKKFTTPIYGECGC